MVDSSIAQIPAEVEAETIRSSKNNDCDQPLFHPESPVTLLSDGVDVDIDGSCNPAEDSSSSENKLEQNTLVTVSMTIESPLPQLGPETNESNDDKSDNSLDAETRTTKSPPDTDSANTGSDDRSSISSSSSSSPSSSSDSSGKKNKNHDNFCVDDASNGNSSSKSNRSSGVWQEIVNDFDSSKGGDQKILRAIGRTATVNAVVTATAALGPIAAVAGYATGGAITAKRLVGDGIAKDNPKEVAKSLAVFGSATSASLAGQAITGAVAIGVLGASLPLAGALAFGAGCVSGITAGALSEWGVDGVMKKNGESKVDTDKTHDPKDDDDGSIKVPATANEREGKTPRNKFFVACGAWVNRQKERSRQHNKKVQQEKEWTRDLATDTAVLKSHGRSEKQTSSFSEREA